MIVRTCLEFLRVFLSPSLSLFPLFVYFKTAQDSLLDQGFAVQAVCVLEPLPTPFTATALDGRIIAQVTHKTVPVTLVTFGNY